MNKIKEIILEPDKIYTNSDFLLKIKATKYLSFEAQGNTIQATTILPSAYTQVDYISSTSYAYSSNYIDTGIYPTNNTSIELKINGKNNSWDRWYGSSGLFQTSLDFGYMFFAWNNTSYQYNIGTSTPVTYILKQLKNLYYINGSLIHTFNVGTFTDTKKLRLFSSSVGDRDSIASIYYCKIWENDVLVRNFIPCYRNVDNVAGLYDTVNNVFYSNAGTGGSFTHSDVTTLEIKSCGDNVNLLDNKLTTQTLNGITFTKNSDGSVTLNGTSTKATVVVLNTDKISIHNKPLYLDNGLPNSIEGLLLSYYVYDDNNNYLRNLNENNYTILSSGYLSNINIYINNAITLNNVTIYPKLWEGTTKTQYSQYNQGIINTIVDNSDGSATQAFPLIVQSPFRAIGSIRDQFVKVDGVWKEKHNIGYIASYNGETITTAYVSSTGALTTGATVIYILTTPNYIICTAEQIAQLNAIQNTVVYDKTNIYSIDKVSPYYIKNINYVL